MNNLLHILQMLNLILGIIGIGQAFIYRSYAPMLVWLYGLMGWFVSVVSWA